MLEFLCVVEGDPASNPVDLARSLGNLAPSVLYLAAVVFLWKKFEKTEGARVAVLENRAESCERDRQALREAQDRDREEIAILRREVRDLEKKIGGVTTKNPQRDPRPFT